VSQAPPYWSHLYPPFHLTSVVQYPILKSFSFHHCYGSSWWLMHWWWHESCKALSSKAKKLFHLGHKYGTWCQSILINNIMSYLSWGVFYWDLAPIVATSVYHRLFISMCPSMLSFLGPNFISLVLDQNSTTKLTYPTWKQKSTDT
jgi:hypothetical protein